MFILMISRGIPSTKYPHWGCFEKDQAEALASIGHKVVVLSIDGRFLLEKRKIGLTHYQSNNVEYYNYFLYPQKITNVFCRKLTIHINNCIIQHLYCIVTKKHGKPDLIYGQMFMNTLKGIHLSKKYNIPIVGIEHLGRFNEQNLNNWGYTEKDAAYVYKNVDAVISVSETLRKSLLHHFNRDSHVVYNVVGKEFYYKQGNSNNNTFTIISTGRLVYGKGYDLLFNALAIIKHQLPEKWKVIIIGDGEVRSQLQEDINSHNLQENILLVGKKNKNEIVELLQNAHMFVLPSRSETFGLVYIEALACGLPIIATDCGVPPEIVTQKNGLFIPKEDVDALSSAISYMVQNINQYDRKAIAEDCQARFSSEVIAKQLTNIFEETIKRHKKQE